MSTDRNADRSGIARLFARRQLRTGFLNFLYFIAGLEALIFVTTMAATVGFAQEPFPWKTYLFTAFTVPIAVTFLLGMVILAFSDFFYGRQTGSEASSAAIQPGNDAGSFPDKVSALIATLRSVPVMATLFFLILAALALYQLNDAVAFVAATGGRMVKLLLLAAAGLVGVGLLLALAWLVMNHQLRRREMEYQYRYRRAAMERWGVLLDEHSLQVDRGRVSPMPFRRPDGAGEEEPCPLQRSGGEDQSRCKLAGGSRKFIGRSE